MVLSLKVLCRVLLASVEALSETDFSEYSTGDVSLGDSIAVANKEEKEKVIQKSKMMLVIFNKFMFFILFSL